MRIDQPGQRDQAGPVNDPPRRRSLASSNRRDPVSGDRDPTVDECPAFGIHGQDRGAGDEKII
jgi:hypothetical protein